MSENTTLSQLSNVKTQLHLANIRIEQLRNSSGDSYNILDELNREKKEHADTQNTLCDVRKELASNQAEKNDLINQYQAYTKQLVNQSENLTLKLNELNLTLDEKDVRIRELEQILSDKTNELEKLRTEINLNHSKNGHENNIINSAGGGNDINNVDLINQGNGINNVELKEQILMLQNEIQSYEETLQKLVNIMKYLKVLRWYFFYSFESKYRLCT